MTLRRARPGRTLAVLTALNGLNYLDRYVLAGVLPLVIADLRLTDAQAGLLPTAFILVYALVAPLPGWLGDRVARLRLAAVGVAIWSAATLGTGWASTFVALLALRAILGVGEASYSVVTPSVLADLYPPGRRGRVLALFYAAIPVGSALGYTLGGLMGTRFGWRSAFYLAGAPGLLLAAALLWLPEPERGVNEPAAPPATTALTLGATLAALRARPAYLVNTAAQAIYTFAIGGLAVWMPTYFVRARGISLERATFIFGAMLALAGLSGTLLGGSLGDKLASRFASAHFTMSGVALLLSAPFTLLAVLSPNPVIFWPSMFVTLFLLFVNTGPLNAAMTNVLPADLRARGFALYTTAIHVLGDGPSPWLIGVASDRMGLRIPVLVTGLLVIPAGILLLTGRRTLIRRIPALPTAL